MRIVSNKENRKIHRMSSEAWQKHSQRHTDKVEDEKRKRKSKIEN